MNRLPIRVRLTLAFALAVVGVLATACGFVFVQMRSDMNDSIDGALQTRMTAAISLLDRGAALGFSDAGLLGERDESLAQLLRPDGRMAFALGAVHVPALNGADLRRATRGRIVVERRLPGFDDTARIFAQPAPGRGGRLVVAVGESLTDRNEALSALVRAFVVAGSIAVVLASLVGYALATVGLRPVETMRRRAAAISLSGEPERLPLGPARDEIRRLGETLNEMLDRLRRSFERERRFVADASHELRSPIAVIKTELEGVLRSGGLGGEQREALVAAVEECDRLAALAEDLLVLARSADGRLPMRPEPLPVARAARGRAAPVRRPRGRARAGRSASRPRRISSSWPTSCACARRWRTSSTTRSATATATSTSVREPRRTACEIDVTDHGAGFGPDLAARAFERFTRASESRSGEGAGLGLAIVLAIAAGHGGGAVIVEGPGGTTVRLTLPAGPPEPATAPAPARREHRRPVSGPSHLTALGSPASSGDERRR